jgi:hypothetical protein
VRGTVGHDAVRQRSSPRADPAEFYFDSGVRDEPPEPSLTVRRYEHMLLIECLARLFRVASAAS